MLTLSFGKIGAMSAVYIHIPFCVKRCCYCDFITYAGQQHLLPEYQKALLAELDFYRQAIPRPLTSLYFGGGTPSVMPTAMIASTIAKAEHLFGFSANIEITLEANPGTLSPGALSELHKAGVNRLSLGVQSFNDARLKTLGRIHDSRMAAESIADARSAGFENLSLDLIFGLPDQSFDEWKLDLNKALELEPEHLSLYSLILEENTPLFRLVNSGKISLPEEDLVADMFEWAIDFLPRKGFHQYEISSWARAEALESRHNKTYWQNLDYLGLGTAAHGRIADWRYHNTDSIAEYIRRMSADVPWAKESSPAADEIIPISKLDAMQEQMMLGLRMTREGVSFQTFRQRFGLDADEVFPEQISRLLKIGLVERVKAKDGEHLRLTRRGIMLGNQVFQEFV